MRIGCLLCSLLILSCRQRTFDAQVSDEGQPGAAQSPLKFFEDLLARNYVNEFAQKGVRSFFIKMDHSPGLDASANHSRKRNEFFIIVKDELAMKLSQKPDALVFVLCHEMGHFFGGPPLRPAFTTMEIAFKQRLWSAAEGQADYYTSLKCLRKIFRDPAVPPLSQDVSPGIQRECSAARSMDSRKLCERSLNAAEALLEAIGKPASTADLPSLQGINGVYLDGHPAPLCRLATVRAGALCEVDPAAPIDDGTAFSPGVCSQFHGNPEGVRPGCWFAPRPEEIDFLSRLTDSYYYPFGMPTQIL